MKKIICLFIITIFISSLTSCSGDQDDSFKVKLLKKVIEVNEDESSSTIDFNYVGNKIATIESEVSTKTFTYTGNLITKIVELDKTTQLSKTSEYIYDGDKLSKVISSENYILNYIHNNNGTVSFEKTTTDVSNVTILLEHGTMYFQNQNLIKSEKIIDTTAQHIQIKETLEFVYDKKLNPLNNISGFSKLLSYNIFLSTNNNTHIFKFNSIANEETGQYTSSLNTILKQYKYDQEGYSKELISEESLLGNSNKNHFKSYYFYD